MLNGDISLDKLRVVDKEERADGGLGVGDLSFDFFHSFFYLNRYENLSEFKLLTANQN